MSLVDEYVLRIIELVKNCDNIAVLDLIVKLLQKSQKA